MINALKTMRRPRIERSRQGIYSTLRMIQAVVWCVAVSVTSLPAEPPVFSVVSILSDADSLNRPHDVELNGQLAFVPGKGGSIAIIDVAHPESPRILWSRLDSATLTDAETVLPIDNYILLGTRDVFAVDVRNPSRPVWTKSIVDRTRIDKINGMARRGHHVFAACKHGWIATFDVRDPASPTLTDALNARDKNGLDTPHDVDVFGRDHIVVVDPNHFGRDNQPGKVAVYRVAHAETHELLSTNRWQLTSLIVNHDLTGANRVQVSGNYAYVAGSQYDKSSNIVVIDLTEPAHAHQVSALRLAATRGPNGLTVVGRVLFAAGGQTVVAIDISNPCRPIKIVAQRLTKVFPEGRDDAHDLVYRDGYLYVTAQNSHQFGILKVNSQRIQQLATAAE